MQKVLLVLVSILLSAITNAQDKRVLATRDLPKLDSLRKCIREVQQNVPLYISNSKDHALEIDVMTIINSTQRYLDTTAKSRESSDVLLRKHYMPLRNFFLTASNKTTISTSFLAQGSPFRFCLYNDTAVALYIAALKDGDTYSEKNMTEKKIASVVFEDCVLPPLKALQEFKDAELKYFAMSVYYGCKDFKITEPGTPSIKPYCLTFVARFADVGRYNDGYITAEELLEGAEVYISNDNSMSDFRKIQLKLE